MRTRSTSATIPRKARSRATIPTIIFTPSFAPWMTASMSDDSFSYCGFTSSPRVLGSSVSGRISFDITTAAAAERNEAETR
ncbi:MAG TPA: hypothetical protein VFU42_05180 [Candidatus Deferrimicrobiaceae bacterium]|nr:hypothetical protein [Candidatus Deferrimicrobiaceae bacterium]